MVLDVFQDQQKLIAGPRPDKLTGCEVGLACLL